MHKIVIGSDHAGWKLKEEIKTYLHSLNGLDRVEINDRGCYSEDSCDYADFAHLVAEDVDSGRYSFGILICGSGNGINMTANKWSNIRSALCWESEIAKMARMHNNANILTLPARFIETDEAIECVKIFIKTHFEEGRHKKRIEKIPKLTN